MYNSIKQFGPDLSIGETEGVRIITKHVSKLSCVSVANHEKAVSSLEPVQLLLRKCAQQHHRYKYLYISMNYTAGSSQIDLTVLWWLRHSDLASAPSQVDKKSNQKSLFQVSRLQRRMKSVHVERTYCLAYTRQWHWDRKLANRDYITIENQAKKRKGLKNKRQKDNLHYTTTVNGNLT